jgi:hypothetical protein
VTKKDYETIAKSIGWTIEDSERRQNLDTKALYYYVGVISEMLKAENPRFDTQRFIDAVHHYAKPVKVGE